MKKFARIFAAMFVFVANPVLAHVSPAEQTSLAAGFAHPFMGVDHLLAMVAVGVWATMLGKGALLAVPATFVGVMVLGFLAAIAGMPLPFVEPAILASVLVLGLAIAFALPVSPLLAAVIAGFFAFFHGHAHGGEIAGATFLTYGVGFVVATLLLHAVGMGIGLGAGRLMTGTAGRWSVRAAGGGIALWGLLMMAG